MCIIQSLKEIYILLKDKKEDTVLQIEKNGNHYFYSIGNRWEKEKIEYTLKCFAEIFKIQKNFLLTKRRLRAIFVELALFKKENPELSFSNLEELKMVFLGMAPKIEDFRIDKTKTSGKGFKGLMERVFIQWHHYFFLNLENDDTKRMLRDIEFICSRMADREFQEGEYVYLSDGIYDIHKVLAGGGAYISILRNRKISTHIKIVCRGTAMRNKATGAFLSGINDLQFEVGNKGVKSIWPKLSHYLKKEKITHVELLGKSLGGVHSQKLAILIAALHRCQILSITTLCSIGVGQKMNELFLKILRQKNHDAPITIRVVRNGGREGRDLPDYLPLFGGDHLGVNAEKRLVKAEIYTIAQIEENKENAEKISGLELQANSLVKLLKAFQSFTSSHIRQTTLSDFTYFLQTDQKSVQKELKRGRELEAYRQTAAWALLVASCGFILEKSIMDEIEKRSKRNTLTKQPTLSTLNKLSGWSSWFLFLDSLF